MLRSWLRRLFAHPPRPVQRLRRASLRLEALEDRTCPTATLGLSGNGVLLFTGGNVGDVVGVSYSPTSNNYMFRDLTEQITNNINNVTDNIVYANAANVHSLQINSGDGSNVIYVSSTAHALTVNGGASNDMLLLGPGGDDPNGVINGTVSFNGGGGYNTLSVNDNAGPVVNHSYTMLDGAIARDTNLVATYDTCVQSVRLNTSKGDDSVFVSGTAATAQTQITFQPVGVGSVVVGNGSGTLDDIHGVLVIDTQAGPNSSTVSLTLNDQGSGLGHTYEFSTWGNPSAPAIAMRRDGQLLVSSGPLQNCNLNTGPGNDTVNIIGTAPGTTYTVATGTGADLVQVGDPFYGLDNVKGNLFLDGGSNSLGDKLIVNDSAAAAGHGYGLQQFEVDRTGAGVINYTNFETLEIDCTQHDDIINDTSDHANMLITVNMGNQAGDTITGGNVDNDYYLTGPNQGYHQDLPSLVHFTGVANILGYIDFDTIHFTDAGSLSGNAIGGTGVETLNYSLCTGDVEVNLTTHTASKVGGTVTGFENVVGGQTNNLLVGDANANSLTGGNGFNVLIGGAGSDSLKGGASDDLLIAGMTHYDGNQAALDLIFAEWKSNDSFTLKQLALTNGVGDPSNPVMLNHQTVVSDLFANSVDVGGGSNWLWS